MIPRVNIVFLGKFINRTIGAPGQRKLIFLNKEKSSSDIETSVKLNASFNNLDSTNGR